MLIKDEQHPTYIILLCKRWTSMISTYFNHNACVKKFKINNFFSLKLMNTNVWIPQNLNYILILTIFTFCNAHALVSYTKIDLRRLVSQRKKQNYKLI